MHPRFHACLWLGLAVSGCDKPKQANSPAKEFPAVPRVTRLERPPREYEPDARTKLREELTSAAEIESAAERENAVAKTAWNALELDPELAREAMDRLPPDSAERIRLIQHLAMRMADENVDAALKWAASLGTEAEQAAACGHIALVISDIDPERAANILSESGIAGRPFDVVAVQVLGRWAAQSPAAAAAWVVMFPPGKSRETGIRSVISSWAQADAQAAFAWMATVQDEPVRRETAQAMAMALIQQPEDVREKWLGHADPQVRSDLAAQWDAALKETGNDARPPSN